MTELNLIVDEIYTIVFNDMIIPEEIFGIFQEKQTRKYYIHSDEFEGEYETLTDYLFMDNANPKRTIRIEDWEIKIGMIDIFPTEIPVK